MIVLRDDGNDDTVSGFHFLDVGHAFFVESDGRGIGIISRGQNNDRQILVDERVGTVLHFTCRIALRVDVGNLFELEGSFKSDGIVNAAAEIEKIGAAEKLSREMFVESGLIGLKNGFDFVRNLGEFLEKMFGSVAGEGTANFSKICSK